MAIDYRYQNFFSQLEQHCVLNENQRDYITQNSSIKKIKKGVPLLNYGDECKAIWFINKGMGRYELKKSNGEPYTAQFFAENEFATDYEKFLVGEISGVTLTALEDLETIELSKSLIGWFMSNIANAPFFMLKQMEYYNVKCNQRIAIHSESEKITAYKKLIELYPDIEQRVAQKNIASFLDISPVHLSRIKSEAIKK